MVLSRPGRFYGMILMRFGVLQKAKIVFGRHFNVFERFYGLVLMRVVMILKAKSFFGRQVHCFKPSEALLCHDVDEIWDA